MQKLLLIDGNAILHRAFHAYPPTFSDKNGHPTNAIYGFYAMFLKVMEEVKPDLLTICFDRGEPTFRMNMYAGYHANRPKMQDTLAEQVPRLQQSLEKIGIPIEARDGYEADDLLGTLSHQALSVKGKGESLETIILTGDRDLLQLVNDHTKILMPITGITNSVLMDSQAVKAKYGITPAQIIDYKALVGDPSDNYPGVMGIGPKTAAGLIQKFDTLENLYAHLGDVKPEVAQKLAQDAEQAMLCKNLATIHLDAPVHLDEKRSEVENFTPDKFLEVFEEFNIHSLARRLMQGVSSESQETKEPKESSRPAKGEARQRGLRSNNKVKKSSEDQLELL